MNENIDFILWECHQSSNPYSVLLHQRFRLIVDSFNKTRFDGFYLNDPQMSTYKTPQMYFLRQTQVDIFRYSFRKKYNKILMFEDDILLANREWITEFCLIEPYLPFYYTLNIGTNHKKAFKYREETFWKRQLLNVSLPNGTRTRMKYYLKGQKSFGAFATAVSYEMLPIFLDLYDIEFYQYKLKMNNSKKIHICPIDNYMMIYDIVNNDEISSHSYDIHPNLVLPDVTHSSMRENKHEGWYIYLKTSDGNSSHYSTYWDLRFAENKTYLHEIQNYIWNITPTFETIMHKQRSCPSDIFLHKESSFC